MSAHLGPERLQGWLADHAVPGACIGLVHGSGVSVTAAGCGNAATGAPVTADSVFDAASLTKPLVAYALLQLVDAGVLDLDAPLAGSIRPVVADDPAAWTISARHLLTHTAGLQNLRSGPERLRLFFRPGSRFSYSSLGFQYLQLAIEACTGESLEATLRRLVFDPLGMRSSSLQWQEAFGPLEARPHEDGVPVAPHRAHAPAASWSLKTTAGDYGAFVAAVLAGARLRPATWRAWLAPAVPAAPDIVQLEAPAAGDAGIAWGLGWGLEPAAGTFFHWGKMSGVRAFVLGSVAAQAGVVLFTNGNTGLRLLDEVAAAVLPGPHPALRWLAAGVSE